MSALSISEIEHLINSGKTVNLGTDGSVSVASEVVGNFERERQALVRAKIQTNTMHEMLHTDATGLVRGLEQVIGLVAGYEWVTEGRGPYEWDDDEYRKEMRRMLDGIRAVAQEHIDRWRRGPLPRACCQLTDLSSKETAA